MQKQFLTDFFRIGCWLFLSFYSSFSYAERMSGAIEDNSMRQVGKATAYWAGVIPIYDAKLFADSNVTLDNLLSDATSIRLALCYRRALSAENFIEAANQALPSPLSEPLQKAVDKLHQRYQSVKVNDCYDLSYSPQQGTELKLNQQLKFSDSTPGFKRLYFSIWLGDKPLSVSVKRELVSEIAELHK